MTETWENEGGAASREEALYHEGARDLASKVVELEDRVEGLESQLHDTERGAEAEAEAIVRLNQEIEQHKTRYANAIKMIERRQKQLGLQRKAYKELAQLYMERGEKYSALVQKIAELNQSVRDLRNVNIMDLDDAIGALTNAIDTAILS